MDIWLNLLLLLPHNWKIRGRWSYANGEISISHHNLFWDSYPVWGNLSEREREATDRIIKQSQHTLKAIRLLMEEPALENQLARYRQLLDESKEDEIRSFEFDVSIGKITS